MNGQKLDCPDCGTPIPYDTYGLLQGKKFACSNCHLTLNLDPQSHESVKNAMEEFEHMKSSLLKQKSS